MHKHKYSQWGNNAMENVNVYETVMAMKHAMVIQSMGNADAHMDRYIDNRNRRTGQTWRVVERYMTDGDGKRCGGWRDGRHGGGGGWERAVVENEHGTRVRIYHRGSCWCVA